MADPTIPSGELETPVIAIDGPAGAGKSTVARRVARRLGVPYVDTGAMYRAVAVLAIDAGLSAPLAAADVDRLLERLDDAGLELRADEGGGTRVWLDGDEVTERLRTPEISRLASRVAAEGRIREALVQRQRQLVRRSGGVMEGRDIGTVVLPDADLKVFLIASAEARARRRWQELQDKGEDVTLGDVRREQDDRDHRDSSRSQAPLRPADDAWTLDTTELSSNEVVARIVGEVTSRRARC